MSLCSGAIWFSSAFTCACQLVSIKNSTLSTERPVLHSLWQLMHYIPTVKQLYYNSWIVLLSFYLSLLRVIEKWSQLRHRAKIDVDFGPCLYQSDLTLQLFICVMAVFRSSWHGAAGMLLQHQEDSLFVFPQLKDLQPETDRQTGKEWRKQETDKPFSSRELPELPAVLCQSHFTWHCPQGTPSLCIPSPSGTAAYSRAVWWTAMVFCQWNESFGNVRPGGCCFSLGKARTAS